MGSLHALMENLPAHPCAHHPGSSSSPPSSSPRQVSVFGRREELGFSSWGSGPWVTSFALLVAAGHAGILRSAVDLIQ